MGEKRKIDVEESKIQGRIVTKEIDKNDPDYNCYPEEIEYDDLPEYDYVDLDEGYDDSIAAIAIPLVILIMAPGFVLLQSSFQVDLAGAILMSVLFLLISFPVYVTIFVNYNKKDTISKEITRKLATKTATLMIWTVIFTLIPAITHANISGDKTAGNRYNLLYGIYIFLFGIDNFLSIIFIREKRIHKRASVMIDRISVIVTTLILWGYGAVISFLLFKEVKWIILFNVIIFATFVGLSIINYIVHSWKAKDEPYDSNAVAILLENSKKILIIFFIAFIAIFILWIAWFFKELY